MYVAGFLTLLMLVLGTACVPKPNDGQIEVAPGTQGDLVILEGTDIGIVPVGQLLGVTLTLKNFGKLAISLEPMEILEDDDFMSYPGSEYPGLGGTCADVLKSLESCTIKLQSFGNDIGLFTQGFIIPYKNGIDKVFLSGQFKVYMGREANLQAVGPIKYDYGIVEPGVRRAVSITIKNTGDLSATTPVGFFDPQILADNIFSFTGGAYPGAGGTCGQVISGGAECSLNLSVLPIEAGRLSKANMKLSYKNPAEIKTFSFGLEVFSAELKAYLSILEDEQTVNNVLNKDTSGIDVLVTWTVVNNGLATASNIAITDLGNIPLTLHSTTCQPAGLLPEETCQLTYKFFPNYAEPLTPPMTFPIRFSNRALTVSYHDGKYITPAVTKEFFFTANVISEGHLNFYKDADNSKLFFNDFVNPTAVAIWPRAEWDCNNPVGGCIIGDPSAGSGVKSLKISNPNIGSRKSATNITYQIIPNDGQIVVACISAGSCPTTINSGGSFTMAVNYIPQYITPYDPEREFIIRVTYQSGRRLKSYDLTIETKSVAKPIITFTGGPTNNLGSILAGKTTSNTFTVKNYGPNDYTPSFTLTNLATIANFDIPGANNQCIGAVLKNGSSCDFDITFTKPDWNGGTDISTQTLVFDNGLDPADPNYQSFSYGLTGEVIAPGYLTYSGGTVNFGKIAWSAAGQADKSFSLLAPKMLKAGGWKVSQFDMTLTGPDAEFFTISQNVPDQGPIASNGNFNPAFEINVRVTSPPLGSGRSPLNASIVVRYYGHHEDDFAGFLPGDEIIIPITATPQNEPHFAFESTNINFGPLPLDLEESAIVRFTNNGQARAPVDAIFQLSSTPAFRITSAVSTASCIVSSIPDATTVIFNLDPGATCEFEVTFKSPGAGGLFAGAAVTYNDSDTIGLVASRNPPLFGEGLNLALLNANPGNVPGFQYNSFGNVKFGEFLTKQFVITNAATASVPAEIVSTLMVAPGTGGCPAISSVPVAWANIPMVNGQNNDYVTTSNTCTAGLQIQNDPPEQCEVTIKFSPLNVNKLIGACLQVTYKRFPSDPATTTLVQNFLGLGIAPEANFNGWHRIFAEGETDQKTPFVKLQWKPMSVVGGTGTVTGYNVYRRKMGAGTFINIPLNPSPVTALQNGEYFEYIDNQSEETTDYPIPLESSAVYYYLVKPIVTLPGVPGNYETSTSQLDKEVRVVLPTPYTVLIHRWTANIMVCTNMFGKPYGDLIRTSAYSCNFNGAGSNGGIYDYARDVLLDRYENGSLSGTPTNNPVEAPHRYSDIAAAKASCDAQVDTIEQLSIIDKKKKLLNRSDFMIASVGQSSTGCVVDTLTAQPTGRNTCKSVFGAEDMIGNAWDLVDTQMNLPVLGSTTWKFGTNSILNNQNWRIPISILDFNFVDFTDHTTFMNSQTYTVATAPCINELAGAPLNDNAGTCPNGSQSFSTYGASMNLNSERLYMLTMQNTEDVFEQWEGKRIMFAGGSYNSRNRFNIEPHRFSTYWTDGYIETTMFSSHPQGPWEGAAARCILEVPY